MLRYLLDLIYPKVCLHCRVKIDGKAIQSLFCDTCLQLLTCISPLGRCRSCFALQENRRCLCREKEYRIEGVDRFAFCLESDVSREIGSLLACQFLQPGWAFLATDLSALMVSQLLSLVGFMHWNLPDLIIELHPIFGLHRHILGQTISELLRCRYLREWRRRWATSPDFFIKRRCNIHGQSVLLVSGAQCERGVISAAACYLHSMSVAEVSVLTLSDIE